MGTQVVRHTSRGVDITLNFASTENNLSWSFTQEGDGEIYDVSLTNVASYTLAGGAVTLPYAVTNGSSYAVSIVKTTTGQTASITFKTRREVNKTTSFSVPDFADLTVASNYILLTNAGNNGQVVVSQNSEITTGNYQGGGGFTNTIIRGTVNLPDIATPYGTPVFSWQCCIHCLCGGNEKILVIGHATASNGNRGRCVCLIDPDTLVVTNLAGTVNSYTYINSTTTSDQLHQTTPTYAVENFVENKILYCVSTSMSEINLSLQNWTITSFPYAGGDVNVQTQTKRQGYYNPIDGKYMGLYGMFDYSRGEIFAGSSNKGAYDYLRNAKIGQISYWGRLIHYDKNGARILQLNDSSSINSPTLIKPKKDLLFLMNNTRIGFMKQVTPFSMVDNAIANSNFTTVLDAAYANADGNTWLYITNTSRMGIAWIDRTTNVVTQGYYDLPAVPLFICSDKILISA